MPFARPLTASLVDAAFSVFGLLYIGLSMSTLYLLSTQDNGPSLLLFLVLVVWSGDIAALYIGRAFGRWKLAPTLSPNKTWEGSFASVAGSILITILLIYVSRVLTAHDIDTLSYPGNPGIWIGLAVLVNVAAQLGDLVESALKRGAGVKDSGTPPARPRRHARPHRRPPAGRACAVVRSVSAAVLLRSMTRQPERSFGVNLPAETLSKDLR